MKITIVQGANFPVPALLGGAVEKKWFALAKIFAARGHSVTHISRLYGDLPHEQQIDGVLHRRVPGFDARRPLFVMKAGDLFYSRRALRAVPDADIMVTHTFWMPLLPVDPSRGLIYAHVARYPKWQHRFYTRAARLQAVSTPIARAVIRQSPNIADRVKVIPNFVWHKRMENTLGPRENFVLYVGRVHPEKGIHLLVKAFTNLVNSGVSGWKLVVVGPWLTKQGGGGQQYYEELRRLSHPSVEFVGPVFDEKRLNEYYDRAGFLVYPSLADKGEAFGLAPLEAMARGCPPLVSDLECFRDFIKDESSGWVFNHRGPGAESELAAKMSEIIRNREVRQAFSRKSLAAAGDFTIDKIATRYLDDFEALLSDKRPFVSKVA